jgi:hypothetical protein
MDLPVPEAGASNPCNGDFTDAAINADKIADSATERLGDGLPVASRPFSSKKGKYRSIYLENECCVCLSPVGDQERFRNGL